MGCWGEGGRSRAVRDRAAGSAPPVAQLQCPSPSCPIADLHHVCHPHGPHLLVHPRCFSGQARGAHACAERQRCSSCCRPAPMLSLSSLPSPAPCRPAVCPQNRQLAGARQRGRGWRGERPSSLASGRSAGTRPCCAGRHPTASRLTPTRAHACSSCRSGPSRPGACRRSCGTASSTMCRRAVGCSWAVVHACPSPSRRPLCCLAACL